MSSLEILSTLAEWTPFLVGGLLWNIAISLMAMSIGSALGSGLAWMRVSPRRSFSRTSSVLTEFTRNIPTFVFQFYLVFILPDQVTLPYCGLAIALPSWIKATLALAIAVVGFVSDNLTITLCEWRAGHKARAMLFLPNWTSYFVVIVMASSASSVIGVSELVSRCNTAINAIGNTRIMLWIYLYAMSWFFLFCYPVTLGMNRIKRHMEERMGR